MCDSDKIQYWVHVDQDTYNKINVLLASHTNYKDTEGKKIRSIILKVAKKLNMEL